MQSLAREIQYLGPCLLGGQVDPFLAVAAVATTPATHRPHALPVQALATTPARKDANPPNPHQRGNATHHDHNPQHHRGEEALRMALQEEGSDPLRLLHSK